MLSSATALANDTSITTKTLMTSLVSTVTNVIEKVKITSSNSVS